MRTFTGLRVNVLINSWIGRGIVAEKKTVCRSSGTCAQDRLDVVDEAHVEHAIRFIEDDHLDLDRASSFCARGDPSRGPACR